MPTKAQHEHDVVDLLQAVVDTLPNVEVRSGQVMMASAIADAIASERHLIVQAGTGTGKTLGYLVPAVASGKRVVVSTYTKALQDQLAKHDLPVLSTALTPLIGREITWAVLKGRNNYLCAQRIAEIREPKQYKLDLEEFSTQVKADIDKLVAWSETTNTGDSGDLSWSPRDAAWRQVSIGSDECPGASRCPSGETCFAERARDSASVADVIVVNTHIYGLDVATDGAILPEHDVVIFDEAHQLEDVMSASVSMAISTGSIQHVIGALRSIVRDDALSGSLQQLALEFGGYIAGVVDKRLPLPLPDDIQDVLARLRIKIDEAVSGLKLISSTDESAKQRILRGQMLSNRLVEVIDGSLTAGTRTVAFVSGSEDRPVLELAPLHVGPSLNSGVWSKRTAILTSATIPLAMPARIGLEEDEVDAIDVGSPFDYENSAILYCAKHLPSPNEPRRDDAVHDELEKLINAAQGRTLALFTTYRAMHAAADEMSKRLEYKVWRQDDLPKMALVDAFATEESSCLFATAGFFQGVDVPGQTLSLVVIDKIPFPRPDDPLLSARRDEIGKTSFSEIDIPLAATQLAQATGRLIRSRKDTGVVAILDPRLATKGYGKKLVSTLPPMKRTIEFSEVAQFLKSI
jgi:ATP-dependent DNA helicase DinG